MPQDQSLLLSTVTMNTKDNFL